MLDWLFSQSQESKNEELRTEIKIGNYDKAKRAIKNGANCSAKDKNGLTAVHLAAKRGDGNLVQLLHLHGADLDACDNEGYTALHYKAPSGKLDAVNALLNAGADPNIRNQDGDTPLNRALKRKNSTQAMALLKDIRTDPHIADNAGLSALDNARTLVYSNKEMILYLLDTKCVDFSIKNTDVNSLLHKAVKENKNIRTVEYILEKGADINAPDKDGDTPLHKAIRKNNALLFKALLDSGADPNMQDKNGMSPLQVATENGSHDAVQYLLKAKATFRKTEKGNKSLLNIAVTKGYSNIAISLLEAGARFTKTDKSYNSLLYIAVKNGHSDLAKHLLEAGAEFDCKSESKESFLYLAAQTGDIELVKALVLAGADFDTSDKGLFKVFRDTIDKVSYQLGIEMTSQGTRATSGHGNLNKGISLLIRAAESNNLYAQYKLARYSLEPPEGVLLDKKAISRIVDLTLPPISLDGCHKRKLRGFDYFNSGMTEAEKEDRKTLKKVIADLNEQLCAALSNILLNEKIPLDIIDAQSGEIIIPANRKITKTLLVKLANVHDHIDIDPCPLRDKINNIIATFAKRIDEAHAVLDIYRQRVLETTPAYVDLKKTCASATDGDVQAQYQLGCFYLNGTDFIKKDIQRAKAWFIAAVKRGHTPSLSALGDCYKAENNDTDAYECFRLAAMDNDPHGQFRFARLMKWDEDPFPLFKLAALGGFSEAQKTLAFMYANGDGVSEDKIMAAKWHQLAAGQGDVESQMELGNYYIEGFVAYENMGLSYRRRKAFSWYKKAAEQGHYKAMLKLAHCYAEGLGTPKDEYKASEWNMRSYHANA